MKPPIFLLASFLGQFWPFIVCTSCTANANANADGFILPKSQRCSASLSRFPPASYRPISFLICSTRQRAADVCVDWLFHIFNGFVIGESKQLWPRWPFWKWSSRNTTEHFTQNFHIYSIDRLFSSGAKGFTFVNRSICRDPGWPNLLTGEAKATSRWMERFVDPTCGRKKYIVGKIESKQKQHNKTKYLFSKPHCIYLFFELLLK